MPPVPIYTQSPINAAKASGVTPQTAAPSDIEPIPKPTATTALPSRVQSGYPAPQPGATPALPAPTGVSNRDGPPPPQPGAVPVPPGTTGSAVNLPYQNVGSSRQPTKTVPYPPQMAIPAPAAPFPQPGTMTATAPPFSSSATGLDQVGQQRPGFGDVFSHPPGYQQDTNASELSSHQRAAHGSVRLSSDRRRGSAGGANRDDDEGVWNSAVKWAQAAGGKLSAAESEVWKRINKE